MWGDRSRKPRLPRDRRFLTPPSSQLGRPAISVLLVGDQPCNAPVLFSHRSIWRSTARAGSDHHVSATVVQWRQRRFRDGGNINNVCLDILRLAERWAAGVLSMRVAQPRAEGSLGPGACPWSAQTTMDAATSALKLVSWSYL